MPPAQTIPAVPVDGQAPLETEGAPPETEGEATEPPRTWDTTDQEAPRTFKFEVLDETSLPDKTAGAPPADTDGAPGTPAPVTLPRPKGSTGGTFKLDIIDPSSLPKDEDREGGQVIYGDIPGASGFLRVQPGSKEPPGRSAPPLTPAAPAEANGDEAPEMETEGETGARTFTLEPAEEAEE